MLRLILAFVDIMLHRRGPEDLPSSRFLVWLLLLVSIGIELGVLFGNDGTIRTAAVSLLIDLLDLWFVWALLRTFNRQGRFTQTMCALLGTEALLNLVSAPLVPWLGATISATEQPQLSLPLVLAALVNIWSIDIAAFTFSRALERPYVLCVAIMLGYALLMASLQATLLAPVG